MFLRNSTDRERHKLNKGKKTLGEMTFYKKASKFYISEVCHFRESQLSPYELRTSVILPWDGDMSRDGEACLQYSCDSEFTMPWTDGDISLGHFAVFPRFILDLLWPLNCVALDFLCGWCANKTLRNKLDYERWKKFILSWHKFSKLRFRVLSVQYLCQNTVIHLWKSRWVSPESKTK